MHEPKRSALAILDGGSSRGSLFSREWEELSTAIYEYHDLFSSALNDLECTELVMHSIDTGEYRPYDYTPLSPDH